MVLAAAVACGLAVASASAETKMVDTKDEAKAKEAPPKILVLAVAADPSRGPRTRT